MTSAVEAGLAAYSCSVSCMIRVGSRETTSPMDRNIVFSDFTMMTVFRAISAGESADTIFNWRNILYSPRFMFFRVMVRCVDGMQDSFSATCWVAMLTMRMQTRNVSSEIGEPPSSKEYSKVTSAALVNAFAAYV